MHTTNYSVYFFQIILFTSVQQIFSLFSYCAAAFRFNTIESNKFIDDDDKVYSDNISLASAVIGVFPCIMA